MSEKKELEPKRAFEVAEALEDIIPDEVLFHLVSKALNRIYNETCDEAFDLVQQCLENTLGS